jgi:IS30 family transposase
LLVVVPAKHKSGKPQNFTRRKVESLSTKVERLQWRRNKVLELSSQGRSQPEIATILQVGLGTISRDIQYLREQARKNLMTHINDRLPEEYQSCITGLKQVLKLSWDIATKTKTKSNNNENGETLTMIDDKTRIQALALANDCYKYIMDLTTNGVVITDAIKFVQTNKEKLTTASKKKDDKESEESDYDEDIGEGQLVEKQGTSDQDTTNQVF